MKKKRNPKGPHSRKDHSRKERIQGWIDRGETSESGKQEMVLEKAILLKCSLALGEALFSGIKRKVRPMIPI